MSKERMAAYVKKLHDVTESVGRKIQGGQICGKETGKMTGTDFENIVYECLLEAGFDKESITHSAQKFPDFILEDREDGDKIGLEVKKTDSAKWEVIGGSIYESLRNDIKDTYVLMAKLGGGEREVRLKKYAECIADLKVTHSPRFYLDLDLQEGEDYLTRNDAVDLWKLSEEELNRKIRKLLRTGKSTWWSDGGTTAFASLSQKEKEGYLNDGIALFPEVFQGNYQQFTPWLVYGCYVWCGNVRDIFSAGGTKFLEVAGIYVSAVMYRALEHANDIGRRILDMTEEEQAKFWGRVCQEPEKRLDTWLGLVKWNLRISKDLIIKNKALSRFGGYDHVQIAEEVRDGFSEKLGEAMRQLL